MTRIIPTNFDAEIGKAQLQPVIFVELTFGAIIARFWTGLGPLSWGGRDFLGSGLVVQIGAVEETQTVESTNVIVTVSGIPSALVAEAYGEFSQGRPALIWAGALNPSTRQLVDIPTQLFSGRMDTISDIDDGSSASIAIACENHLADLQRPNARYFTNEDQKRVFAGDQSFRFIPGLQEKSITWGKPGADFTGAMSPSARAQASRAG